MPQVLYVYCGITAVFRYYWQQTMLQKFLRSKTSQLIPCAWPPRSKVVKVMPAIVSSSEASSRHFKKVNVEITHKVQFLSVYNVLMCLSGTNSLGCKVGTCCPNLSSLSMCSSVVLPALSRPRNTNLPDFLYSPKTKPGVFSSLVLFQT